MKTTVYRTSDDSPLVPALIEVRRGRAPERLPRRAQGALRRAPQHRVVARDRARGRPRRLRVPQPEDPREDDADRPAGGERPSPLRPYRDRELPRAAPPGSTRTSASSPPTRRSRPTSPTSSTTSPASAGRRRSASFSSRRSTCASASSRRSVRSPRRPATASTRAFGSRRTPSPTRRSSRSSTRPPRRAPRSTSSARSHLPAPPRRPRALGDDPRPQRPRALPRAQPLLRLRGGRLGVDLHGQRRPHDPQPRPPDRDRRAGRGRRACRLQLAAAFDVLLEDNTRMELQPDGGWKRLRPQEGPKREGQPRRAHAQGADARPAPGRPPAALVYAERLPADRRRGEWVALEGRHRRCGLEHRPPARARRQGGELVTLREEREHLFLGEDVERDGPLSRRESRRRPGARAASPAAPAKLGARTIEVIVTAPGRQSANADRARARRSGGHRRARARPHRGRGGAARVRRSRRGGRARSAAASRSATSGGGSDRGASSEPLKAGLPGRARSTSVRCASPSGSSPTTRPAGRLSPPPGARWSAISSDFTPPLPQAAFATGGTARALRKFVGWELEGEEFDAALRILGKRPSAKVAKTFGLHAHRARTLAAGVVILSCLQARLGVPLEVSRAGLREGAAIALLDELAASAA